VLFVDTVFAPKTDWSNRDSPTYLLFNPAAVEALDADVVGPVFRRLVVQWADKRPKVDPMALLNFCALAAKHPFVEAVPILARLAKDKSASLFTGRVIAIQALGKVGGKDSATTLGELIYDRTSVSGEGPEEVRVGDVAFAALLTLNGKELKDYSLQYWGVTGFGTGVGDDDITLKLYKFSNPDARIKAIEKWKNEVGKK